jgi:DNA-binding MarR family transcriptional regulator
MQQLKSEDPKIARHDPAIARDADGRLYDAVGREFISRMPGDDFDHAVFEAVGALHTATHRMHNLMERWVSKHGLTEGRMRVLFILRFGPRTLGDLAERMRVSPRNITGLVDGLEGDGLVERVPDPGDRRAVRAQLTAKGAVKVAEVGEQMLGARRSIAEGFTNQELIELRHLCLKLFANVEKIEGEG